MIVDPKLDYPAYHEKTALDLCWDHGLESYAFEDDVAEIVPLIEDSTLFNTKKPVFINDQDPTEEDIERALDYLCGPGCECDQCYTDLVLYDPKNKHKKEEISTPEKDRLEKNIGMCEYTLIHCLDDLEAAKSLFKDNHWPQCVFFCTQVVEKALKSLCSLFDLNFRDYVCEHSGKCLTCLIQCYKFQYRNYEKTSLFAKLRYLSIQFELIGSSSWGIKECLSIRSRYFYYDESYSYAYQSYPGLVYDHGSASEALRLSEEIFGIVANLCEGAIIGAASVADGECMCNFSYFLLARFSLLSCL